MYKPIQRMSAFTRVSITIYDWSTVLTAAVIVPANGIRWQVGWALVLFGVLVDLNRSVARATRLKSSFGVVPIELPIRTYLRPGWSLYIMLGTVTATVILYFSVPDICWPAFNSWIETNIAVVKRRLAGFPDTCDIPHGAVLLFSQSLLPIITLLAVAIPVTSADVNPERFVRDLPNETGLTLNPPRPNLLLPGLIVIIVLLLIALSGILVFTPDGIDGHRSIRPQSNILHFILWWGVVLTGVFLFINAAANMRAILPIRVD